MVHGRPNDHDCFDGFAEHYHDNVEFINWRDVGPREPGHLFVSCIQDPVGKNRAAALMAAVDATPGATLLNAPHIANMSQRQFLYTKWTAEGLLCPEPPKEFDYEFLKAEGNYPYLVKDLHKQLGRGYVIQNEDRLDWLYLEATRFNIDRFWSISFEDLHDENGFYVMQRYLVAGDKVLPGMLAKTKKWNCKASHMPRDIRKWTEEERTQYVEELEEFWISKPHPDILKSVRISGLDFCTVDCTLVARGKERVPMLWELNPMLNLNPSTVIGKPQSWWRFLANFLFETNELIYWPSAREQVRHFMTYEGGGHWASLKKEGR